MDRIDELLLDWYEWSQGYNPGTDYRAFDSTCAHFRSSRQWLEHDDIDAEIEWSRKKSVGKAIEPLIQKLDLKARVAVSTAMRNFSSGGDVWSSVRVSDHEDEYARAKEFLRPFLIAAGLIEHVSVSGWASRD